MGTAPPQEARVLEPLQTLRLGARTAWVIAPLAGTVGPALLTGAGCSADPAAGRASVQRFRTECGEAILRTYHRGGAARHVLPDGYLLGNRPRAEFEVHRAAYAAGLAVPRPLGVCWERHAGVLRGAIVTEALDGPTLHDALLANPPEGPALLAATGTVVRALHDAGIWHADLQLRNVLVTDDGPYLIDFDRARRVPRLDAVARARNLLRFRRSLDKNLGSSALFGDMLRGYGLLDWPAWLDAAYMLRGRFSAFFGGR